MYWTDGWTKKIQRANLDGTNVEDLVTGKWGHPEGIALDVAAGKMYWVDSGMLELRRANLDGSNVEDLVGDGLAFPTGIALDMTAEKIYWTDFGTGKVQRADLDGSNVEDLVSGGIEECARYRPGCRGGQNVLDYIRSGHYPAGRP